MGKSTKEPKDGEIAKLKKHIHHLDKEIARLKSELRTYDRVFNKQVTFLKEKTRGLSLEELIAGANADLNLQQIKDEQVHKFEDMQKKWQCFKCGTGIMKLIIIPYGEKSAYFRRCSNPKCLHRTEPKEYTEDVEGVK